MNDIYCAFGLVFLFLFLYKFIFLFDEVDKNTIVPTKQIKKVQISI